MWLNSKQSPKFIDFVQDGDLALNCFIYLKVRTREDDIISSSLESGNLTRDYHFPTVGSDHRMIIRRPIWD